MKQLTRILIVAMIALGASALAFGQAKDTKMAAGKANPDSATEQALIALDRKWTAAELRLNDEDKKTIDGIVAEDYWGTTPEGQLRNKAQYMAGLKHTEDTDVADEYSVRFFDGGKLAIMTHRGVVNGKPTYRSTHVWVKRGNAWLLIQNHVSNIEVPPA